MDEVNEKIIKNLKKFGLSSDDIKPNTMEYLIKVDDVLNKITTTRAEAIQTIKSEKASINKVAKESGISRQTFYNNPIITSYVEKYIEIYVKESPYETINNLKEEIKNRDEQIEKLVQRDANIAYYKAENKELSDEVESLKATIKSQEEMIRKLRMKMAFN